MGSKDKEKKRQRVSSSGAENMSEDQEQNGACIKMTVKEYQDLLGKLTVIEDQAKERDARILNLEARLDEAQAEVHDLKQKLSEIKVFATETKESLEFTQGEQEDLVQRVTQCETEQSAQWNEITQQDIYSRRWNLIFYRIQESSDEDCPALLRSILIEKLEIANEEVQCMSFCSVHRLGKPNRSKARPIIARFTCRADRDKVWKCRYRLKNSNISMSEDLPKQVQEIRKNVLVPAMKNIKKDNPFSRATVVGDKLVVNGKRYFHYEIPKSWLQPPPTQGTSAEGSSSQDATEVPSRASPPTNQDEQVL